jgi:hypothetical protein
MAARLSTLLPATGAARAWSRGSQACRSPGADRQVTVASVRVVSHTLPSRNFWEAAVLR